MHCAAIQEVGLLAKISERHGRLLEYHELIALIPR